MEYSHPIKTHRFFSTIIAMIAALSGILFGYDTGVISGALLFIKQDFHLTDAASEVLVSAVLIGALLGAIFSGRLADHLGRKKLLVSDALIFIIGTAITVFFNSMVILFIGRVVVGLAIGVASYVAPLYISEISPATRRGALVSLNQLAITIGIFLSYIIDYYFAGTGAWRWMLGIGMVPAFCLFLGMLYLPDSPRWMVAKGMIEKARAVLKRTRTSTAHAEAELKEIQSSLNQQKGNWKMLFSKMVRPTLIIGAGLALLQQVTGVNTILYYAPTIFESAGFVGAQAAILATMGVGAVFVLFTLIGLPLIDTLGRRKLLFIGLCMMAVSLLMLSFTFFMNAHSASNHFLRWGSLISMLVFIAGFAISLGPIMWLMISEIFPLKVRGLGSSLATCVNWGSNWLVAITFLSLIDHLGSSGTFLIYAALCVVSIWFVHVLVPETKNVSLEQIEENLYAGKKSRDLGQPLR